LQRCADVEGWVDVDQVHLAHEFWQQRGKRVFLIAPDQPGAPFLGQGLTHSKLRISAKFLQQSRGSYGSKCEARSVVSYDRSCAKSSPSLGSFGVRCCAQRLAVLRTNPVADRYALCGFVSRAIFQSGSNGASSAFNFPPASRAVRRDTCANWPVVRDGRVASTFARLG
jgi:hypothetical protein